MRSYWLVDPVEVSVTVLELEDGEYRQVAHVVGEQACDVLLPYPLKIVPSRLLD